MVDCLATMLVRLENIAIGAAASVAVQIFLRFAICADLRAKSGWVTFIAINAGLCAVQCFARWAETQWALWRLLAAV